MSLQEMTPAEFERQVDEFARLSLLTPADPKKVLFVGRAGGHLIDNCKYAFLEACRHDFGFSPLFLTWHKSEHARLKAAGLPAALFPSDIRQIAACGAVVCDDFWWRTEPIFALLHNRPSFQLWHGIPLKAIGKSEVASTVNMDAEKARYLESVYSGYDAVLATSDYTSAQIFARVFYDGVRVPLGYPRNDPLLRKPSAFDLLGSDPELLGRIRAHKRAGGKVAFFMPTFRDSGGDPFSDQALDLARLDAFCREQNLLFVMKLHPYVQVEAASGLSHLVLMQSSHDAYPLLGQADLLVTDYSSVYFDFLLTGRPVIYYIYDLEKYLSCDREFMLDFEAVSPGHKVRTQTDLFAAIADVLETGDDGFAMERQTLCTKLFAEQDAGSSRRVCEYVRDHLLPMAEARFSAQSRA